MGKKIFVLNCGSSSIKFRLFDMEKGGGEWGGKLEMQGDQFSMVSQKEELRAPLSSYEEALIAMGREAEERGVTAIGHRIVHGGELFREPAPIDRAVREQIGRCSRLAPLHNPRQLFGIEVMARNFPRLPQVAVFDTAFHQTLPERAFLYGIDYSFYRDHQIRRFGFHGISHAYVAQQAALLVGRPLEECSFISCHLGNGCSIAAISKGKSVDTSMGLTPLEGVLMGERSGDLDPTIVALLSEILTLPVEEVIALLNHKSGLLGLSGVSSDMRVLLESRERRAAVAIEVFCYRIAKYIASYLVPLQGEVDGVIFTGGIGENAPSIRSQIMELLSPFQLRSWAIPTEEEWMIAVETLKTVEKKTS